MFCRPTEPNCSEQRAWANATNMGGRRRQQGKMILAKYKTERSSKWRQTFSPRPNCASSHEMCKVHKKLIFAYIFSSLNCFIYINLSSTVISCALTPTRLSRSPHLCHALAITLMHSRLASFHPPYIHIVIDVVACLTILTLLERNKCRQRISSFALDIVCLFRRLNKLYFSLDHENINSTTSSQLNATLSEEVDNLIGVRVLSAQHSALARFRRIFRSES